MFKFTNDIFWAAFSGFWFIFCSLTAFFHFDNAGLFYFYVLLASLHGAIAWLRIWMYYDNK